MILQLTVFVFDNNTAPITFVTLCYDLSAGIFLTASNLMLLESMTHIDASMGSTIYRLNTLGVVVLALLFLNETMGLYKGLGIAAGILSVFLLYRQDTRRLVPQRTFVIYFSLAVIASLFRALYGITS